MKKSLLIPSLVIAGLFLAACTHAITSTDDQPPADSNQVIESPPDQGNNDSSSSTSNQVELSKTFTLAEVAKHSTASDCWLVIDDQVYDVTPFIASGKHPGGEAILQGCGQDATVLFNTRPMGSGTAHSGAARALSKNFIIGKLAQ